MYRQQGACPAQFCVQTNKMKAIILDAFGGADNLVMQQLPLPSIQPNEVLVQVKAISINPVDVKTRTGRGMAGRLKDIHPLILGWDISGIVAEVGAGVTQFKKGDAVFGMVNFPGHGKAYAEYVAAPAHHLAVKPANTSHEEAAAATLAALTAWQVLTTHATVQPGARVLVHAAAGGVGHYAVQMARHLGAYVIGTASAANRDFVLGLGAQEHIDYHATPFEEVVSNIDLVFDAVGGELITRSIDVIKPGGTLISIPTAVPEADKAKAAQKGITADFKLVQSSGDDMQQVARLLEQGIVQSHVSAVFPFEAMRAAHASLETGRTRGKLVIKVD